MNILDFLLSIEENYNSITLNTQCFPLSFTPSTRFTSQCLLLVTLTFLYLPFCVLPSHFYLRQ